MFETKDVEENEEDVLYSIEFFCTVCVSEITEQDRVQLLRCVYYICQIVYLAINIGLDETVED